jgi:hypothetical protein
MANSEADRESDGKACGQRSATLLALRPRSIKEETSDANRG